MEEQKRLYRSNDSLISGVSAGIAEYFNVDPIVVRILVVILTIATSGVFAIAYIALWVILPKAHDKGAPVDVQPHDVRSDTYGQVSYENFCSRQSAYSDPTKQPGSPYPTGSGMGHIPPVPPYGFGGTHGSQSSPQGGPQTVPHAASSARQSTPPQGTPMQGAPHTTSYKTPRTTPFTTPYSPPYSPPYTTAYTASRAPGGEYASEPSWQQKSPEPDESRGSVKAALWLGFILLFVGLIALLGHFVEGVQWWQFWPLILIISGIGYMVIPGKRGERMAHFSEGLTSFVAGAGLLLMSLDIVSYISLDPIFTNLWPLLIMMAGFYILAAALKMSLFTLCGAFCFVIFCVVGLVGFAIPGSTDVIQIITPYYQTYVFDINPWVD